MKTQIPASPGIWRWRGFVTAVRGPHWLLPVSCMHTEPGFTMLLRVLLLVAADGLRRGHCQSDQPDKEGNQKHPPGDGAIPCQRAADEEDVKTGRGHQQCGPDAEVPRPARENWCGALIGQYGDTDHDRLGDHRVDETGKRQPAKVVERLNHFGGSTRPISRGLEEIQ